MVKFNELYVTPDNSTLVIDVEIEDICWYKLMFIHTIQVVPHDKYTNSSPSDTDYKYIASDLPKLDELSLSLCKAFNGVLPEDEDLVTELKNGRKRVRLILKERDLGFSLKDKLFFVYVNTKGIPDPNTPCGLDKSTALGITYNQKSIKDSALSFIKGSLQDIKCNSCTTNATSTKTKFMDFILRNKAFSLYLDTGNYLEAIKTWDKLTKSSPSSNNSKPCSCNG